MAVNFALPDKEWLLMGAPPALGFMVWRWFGDPFHGFSTRFETSEPGLKSAGGAGPVVSRAEAGTGILQWYLQGQRAGFMKVLPGRRLGFWHKRAVFFHEILRKRLIEQVEDQF